MLDNSQTERVKFFLRHHGIENQMLKAVEEMAELQKEIIKMHFALNFKTAGAIKSDYVDSFIEELADVNIVITQLNEIANEHFGILTLREKIEEKVEKHEKLIRKEKIKCQRSIASGR